MRYYPSAIALSLLVAVTASMGQGATPAPSARVAALLHDGGVALSAGDTHKAIDAFEAALAVDPGYTPIYLHLAEAARAQGMQGKAIHYYRSALEREPANFAAIAGEGQALVEKGALEKARRNLARLEGQCGQTCPETQVLAERIAKGPAAKTVVTAEAVTPEVTVTQN